MRPFLIWITFSVCFFHCALSQIHIIDSLVAELSAETNDSSVALLQNAIAKEYYSRSEYGRAMEFATLALKKENEIISSPTASASEKKWCKSMIAKTTTTIGAIHWRKAEHGLAIRYLLKALSVKEELQDTHGVAISNTLIGLVHWDLSDTLKARKHYMRAFSIYEKLKEAKGLGKAAANVGNTYVPGDPDAAVMWFDRSLKFAGQANDSTTIGNVFNSLGALYDELKQYEKGIDYYHKAYELNRRTGNISGQISTNLNLGSLLLNRGYNTGNSSYYKEARLHFSDALLASKQIGAKDSEMESYRYLMELDTLLHNYSGAFENYKLYIACKDSVVNEENTKKIVEAQLQYEFDKKVNRQKAEQEKKDALSAEELKNQKMQRNYFIAGFVLILALALLILRSFFVKKRANQELAQKNLLIEQQKRQVEEKQKEVLDSIYYARRIQRALITNEKYFSKHLKRLKPDL